MSDDTRIRVELASQQLYLIRQGREVDRYTVSSARNGPGELMDSGCTPRGRHRIRIGIGAGCPENTVFVGRRATGEIYSEQLQERFPDRDWILTRILWLTGLQSGQNRGGRQDTLRRFIYIHGCPDSEPMGLPRSHGCIRMRNRDILALFPQVRAGTIVDITE